MANATIEVRPVERNQDGILTKIKADIIWDDEKHTHHEIIFDATNHPEEAMSIEEITQTLVRMYGGKPGKIEPLYD